MSGRLPLVVVLAAFIGGCATIAEERLSLLESAVLDMQAQEMRLASLEDTVAGLVARDRAALSGPRAAPAKPVPAQPAAAPVPPHPSPAAPLVSPTPQAAPPAVPVKNAALAARQYQAALSALESGRPQAALEQLQGFLAAHPGHTLAPNAGYWLGECHYSMKQYDAAVSAFKDVVAQYPAHEKAAAAMLKAGYSYALLGDGVNARFYLEALIRDFPSSQPASLARTRLASL